MTYLVRTLPWRARKLCSRRSFIALVLMALATPSDGAFAQQPSTRTDTAAWLADFAQLKSAMSQHYANLDWAVERRSMQLGPLSQRTEAALRAATTEAAARAAIEAFLNGFGDGHLEVRWPTTTAPSDQDTVSRRPVCERLGYRRAQRGGGIRFEQMAGFRWLASPDSVYFRAGVMNAGGERIGILRIASFEDNIHPELCEEATRALGIAIDAPCNDACAERVERATANRLTAILERRIASLNELGVTRLLVDLTGNGGGSNWVEAAARTLTPVPLQGARVGFIRHPHYVRAFDARIERLVRDSAMSHGDQRIPLARALAILRQQRWEAGVSCDRSGIWEGHAPACSLVVTDPSRYSTGVLRYAAPDTNPARADAPSTVAGQFAEDVGNGCCDLFYPARYRYREGVYRGPLLVLVDGGTASAAEYFAALIADNGAGVVLGAPTFGAGCGYTDGGIPSVLRHSRGRVLMPDCTRYRSSGLNEVEGIEPHIPVLWRRNDTPLQRARRVAEALKGHR